MENEQDPTTPKDETADTNEEAITGRADEEEEFEDTEDIDEESDDVDGDAGTETE